MRLLLSAVTFLAISVPAEAALNHRHHRHHHYHNQHAQHRHAHRAHHRAALRISRRSRANSQPQAQGPAVHQGGMVTVQTAAGRITVASHLAPRFQALIADFVAHGYKPRHIGCYAHGGHVPNSRHYAGAACDFDQRGWGLTHPFMYRARAIIARHGFRDGCSFNDCGHVDDGLPTRRAHRWRNRSES